MTTSDRPVTLIANDGGRVQLSETAARQSAKLAALLDAPPEQSEIVTTDFADTAERRAGLTTATLQHVADVLEHFVTTPYPHVVKLTPSAPSWDDIGGQWLGARLRQMDWLMMNSVLLASSTLGCAELLDLVCSYSAYRLNWLMGDVDPALTRAENERRAVARHADDSYITP